MFLIQMLLHTNSIKKLLKKPDIKVTPFNYSTVAKHGYTLVSRIRHSMKFDTYILIIDARVSKEADSCYY